MYYLRDTDNSFYPVTLTARATGSYGGFGSYVGDGVRYPHIEVTLTFKGMNYAHRTATFDCSIEGYGSFKKLMTGVVSGSIYNVPLFSVAVSDMKTWSGSGYERFELTTEVTLPYEEDGTMDNINFIWEGISIYGRSIKVESAVTGWDKKGFIRPLQSEPFFLKSPLRYYEAGYVNNFWQEEYWYFIEHDVKNFNLCVPYVPTDANKLKMYIPVPNAEDTFWEYTIEAPEVGNYEGIMQLSGEGRYKLIQAAGSNNTKVNTQFLISFAINNVYQEAVSKADPFSLRISLEQPVVVGSVRDTNAATIALTGDDSILILNESNALATITAQAVGTAIIRKKTIQNGNGDIMEGYNEYNFENVTSNIFYFSATDSMNYSTTERVVTPYVDYVKPSASFKGSIVTGTGDMNFKVVGNYYSGSFGLVDNEIFVYYRYKVQGADDSEYTDWITLSDIDINAESRTYSISGTVHGLDYNQVYVFQAHIADALNTIYGNEYVAVSIPIFDWSNEDFNFNVPVTVMGSRIGGDNPILWSGNDVMAANATAQLSEPISAQMHGVILVFSNATGNVSWNTGYVPKAMVDYYGGGGHTFLMAVNAGLSTFGAKYLYISDDSITGHATNQESGTSASGIKFSNQNYVLRYVIGV